MNIRNIIIITATLALGACSSQDDPWGGKLDSPVAAEFSGNIENVATRASGSSWATNDAIGITGGGFTNIKYVTAAGDGKFAPSSVSEAIFFKANQVETEFKAYYPYCDEYSDNPGIISANTKNQTETDQSKFDFLWATASASHETPTATFDFEHKMTKLKLNIQWNAANSGISKTEFESATFALGGIKLDGEFDTTTGTALATGTATENWSLTVNTSEDGNEKISRSFNLILFPQSNDPLTEKTNLTVIVTIGGQEYACDITPTLAPGTSYTYTITVKKVGLEVSTNSITNWVADGGNYTGEAIPLPDLFNGHTAVKMRNASGNTPALYFADRNIGADSPEEYGLHFWWGDVIGYQNATDFDFTESNTDIKTYNKSADKLKSEGIITTNDFTTAILTTTYDAAQTQWSGEWRMPTPAEWQWLISNDNCVWAWWDGSGENLTFSSTSSEEDKFSVATLYSGVGGYYVKSRETGQIIFLPAIGVFEEGALSSSNTHCNYWSSMHGQTNTHARYCALSKNSKLVTTMVIYVGATIRPVLTK